MADNSFIEVPSSRDNVRRSSWFLIPLILIALSIAIGSWFAIDGSSPRTWQNFLGTVLLAVFAVVSGIVVGMVYTSRFKKVKISDGVVQINSDTYPKILIEDCVCVGKGKAIPDELQKDKKLRANSFYLITKSKGAFELSGYFESDAEKLGSVLGISVCLVKL